MGISWERGISHNTTSGDKEYKGSSIRNERSIRKKRESSMGVL
jgi:hypothetical protein